jgi:hypothetical protein
VSLKLRVVVAVGLGIEQSIKTDSTSHPRASGRERLSLYQPLSIGADAWNVSPFRYA